MFEISSDDIMEWADRYEAAAGLPKLVRRLVAATSDVSALRFPADGGVRLRGFDGVLEAARGGPRVPDGLSVWELSVEKQPLGKIAGDFKKRSAAFEGRGSATYVAVVARRCAHKGSWAAEQKLATSWKDVRVIDVEDLAAWLEEAPAVAVWFASELGRPVAEALPLAERATAWSRRTNVALPVDALLLGSRRERAAETLRAWARHDAASRITIRAPTVDEAVTFAATALTTDDSDLAHGSGVVIEGRQAWRWITRHASRRSLLLVVPADEVDVGEAPGHAKVIIATDASHASAPADIELSAVPWGKLRDLLTRSGLDPEKAERFARDCAGDLSALQRLLGHVARPQWIEAAPFDHIAVLALAGCWDPASAGDRAAVSELGIEPSVLDATCAVLARSPGEAVVAHSDSGRSCWTFRSAPDAWREIAARLGPDSLERFVTTAERVLAEPDPKYDLPVDQRWYAALHGKVRGTSSFLRRGIAESLVRLATLPMRPGNPRADDLARAAGVRVVRAALPPGSWSAWAGATDIVPLLCEAAPEAFVDAVEESLAEGSEGVARLLSMEDAWGGSPHTGLLWALERACWRPDLAARAIIVLAELAALDPGGRSGNRPSASLWEALDPFFPDSSTTGEQRVRLMARIADAHPAIGWKLALQHLHRTPGRIVSPTERPAIADWGAPEWPQRARPAEVYAQVDAACTLALRLVDGELSRWPELMRTLLHLEDPFRERILDRLDALAAETLGAQRELLRTSVRGLLHLMRFGQKRRDREDELLPRLETVLERLAPADAIERGAWLFKYGPVHLPDPVEDWRDEQQKIGLERRKVVDAVLPGPPDLESLSRFAQQVEGPGILGTVLAERSDAEEWLRAMTIASEHEELAPVLASLAASLDRRGANVLLDTVRDLHARDRVDGAILVARTARPSPALWTLLDELGSELAHRYWSPGVFLWDLMNPDEWSRALSRLVDAGALASALEQAGHAAEKSLITPEQALAILEAVVGASDAAQIEAMVTNQSTGYHVEQLLDRVDDDETIPDTRVIELELTLLPFLRHSRRGHRKLGEALARDPQVFVNFLCMIYRDAREPRESTPEPTEERRHAVERAYHVLEEWSGAPGWDASRCDEDALRAWVDRAIALATERGRAGPAINEVARVLARAPVPSDGAWPCLTARALVEAGSPRWVDEALAMARRNMRGVVTRTVGEGGRQEHQLAAQYRADAVQIEAEWPRTASLLRALAKTYEAEGRREDAEAASERERYGLDG